MWDVLTAFRLNDLIDIALVALVVYWLLRLIAGARSYQVLQGLVLMLVGVAVVYLAAIGWELRTLQWAIRQFSVIGAVLFFAIVFQPELRRTLAALSGHRLARYFFAGEEDYLGEVVEAARILASKRVGALIVLGRRDSLKAQIETGQAVDSRVSAPLLCTLFSPYSPLHDGAAIVSGGRIVAAGCILPLLKDMPKKGIGTRHLASMGVTEETDAVAVVVSEETGTISLALKGKLTRKFDPESLRRVLNRLFDRYQEKEELEA